MSDLKIARWPLVVSGRNIDICFGEATFCEYFMSRASLFSISESAISASELEENICGSSSLWPKHIELSIQCHQAVRPLFYTIIIELKLQIRFTRTKWKQFISAAHISQPLGCWTIPWNTNLFCNECDRLKANEGKGSSDETRGVKSTCKMPDKTYFFMYKKKYTWQRAKPNAEWWWKRKKKSNNHEYLRITTIKLKLLNAYLQCFSWLFTQCRYAFNSNKLS